MNNFKKFLLVELLGILLIAFFGIIIHFLDTASTPFHSVQFGFWALVLYQLGISIIYLISIIINGD